jgi:hypothetical protein
MLIADRSDGPVMLSIARAMLIVLGIVSVGTSCRSRAPTVATRPRCERGEVASWSTDSAIAVCLPPGFHPVVGESGHVRWERGDIRSRDRAWLSIDVDSSNDSSNPWPPALGNPSGCLADCGSADSVTRYRDTVATGVAVVEVGLVSGGFAGLRRQPMMVAGWELPRGRRVWVNGYAAESPTLDTLRRAVRSVQLVTF